MTASLSTTHILLADDDRDDGILFQAILDELPLSTHLTIAFNGDQLMQLLNDTKEKLPDIVFLDLNMPRKNGFSCLLEIKRSERLKPLSVVIYSTSYENEVVSLLYQNGARFYIHKPNSYKHLKKLIYQAITLSAKVEIPQRSMEQFVLS